MHLWVADVFWCVAVWWGVYVVCQRPVVCAVCLQPRPCPDRGNNTISGGNTTYYVQITVAVLRYPVGHPKESLTTTSRVPDISTVFQATVQAGVATFTDFMLDAAIRGAMYQLNEAAPVPAIHSAILLQNNRFEAILAWLTTGIVCFQSPTD